MGFQSFVVSNKIHPFENIYIYAVSLRTADGVH